MNVAERIRKVREVLGITANELAQITGIHPVSIRKYETEKMIPGREVIDKMCEALKVPRILFEGFPKQTYDFQRAGEFYQQLFTLTENNTISMDTNKNGFTFALNPELSKYMILKHGDDEIPLNEIHLELNEAQYSNPNHRINLIAYHQFINAAKKAQNNDSWDEESEPKDKYIARMMNEAEKHQLELMLTGYSWEQYMTGRISKEMMLREMEQEIKNGGDYYTAVEKMDIPEKEKAKMFKAYEEAYISGTVEIEDFPGDKEQEEKEAWAHKKALLAEEFKKAHPDYPELAREHARKEAEKARTQSVNTV